MTGVPALPSMFWIAWEGTTASAAVGRSGPSTLWPGSKAPSALATVTHAPVMGRDSSRRTASESFKGSKAWTWPVAGFPREARLGARPHRRAGAGDRHEGAEARDVGQLGDHRSLRDVLSVRDVRGEDPAGEGRPERAAVEFRLGQVDPRLGR